MLLRRRFLWISLLSSLLYASFPLLAENSTEFIRFDKLDKDAGRLQTAIVTYRNHSGAQVTLFAAVHIADAKYYYQLQRLFEDYDALLYEMVKPDSAVPTRGGGSGFISFLQRAMKLALNLEFQLDAIDYTRDNFVHADMNARTFARMQRQNRESLLSLMIQLWMESMRRESMRESPGAGIDDLFEILRSKDRSRKLKLFFAEEMQDLEGLLAGLEGGGRKSVILSGRNEVALEVLKGQLAQGRRNLGIFYGAAHMADLEARLRALGFHKTEARWITAWTMVPRGWKPPRRERF